MNVEPIPSTVSLGSWSQLMRHDVEVAHPITAVAEPFENQQLPTAPPTAEDEVPVTDDPRLLIPPGIPDFLTRSRI
jgi:hypothetical protein